MGHPAAAAAGLAVTRAILDRGLLPRVRRTGEALAGRLAERLGQHPHVGDIRGRGLFLGLELLADRESRAPFDPARRINARVKASAFDSGLICYPMGGTIDGRSGDHVLIAPPFILSDAEAVELTDKLAAAIDAAIATSG